MSQPKMSLQFGNIVRSEKINSLPPSVRWLYAVLYVENDGSTEPFLMPYESIRAVTGFSNTTIGRAIKGLESKGLLSCTRGGLEANPNIYRLLPQDGMVAAHGRNLPSFGQADWEVIKRLKDELSNQRRPQKGSSAGALHFQRLRNQRILDTDSHCEVCGFHKGLILHHRHYNTWGQETTADVILLCGRCHRLVHPPQTGSMIDFGG